MLVTSRVRIDLRALVAGVLLGCACGPSPAPERCYDVVVPDPEPRPPLDIRVCGRSLPTDREHPEFEDGSIVRAELPGGEGCPMCADELDAVFWDAFLDLVEVRGLDDEEDPDCVNQGYAIEVACRIDDGSSNSCRYEAYLVSHCTLGPNYVP